MSSPKILIVSGTHGNEINPIWAANKFKQSNQSSNLSFALGNPLAVANGKRYVDIDLNRSFNEKNNNSINNSYESKRAEYLTNKYGPEGLRPFQIVFDLHTTTSSMGTCIVMYGRREKDFCLAAILQYKFGLPIYLHENDCDQKGFLVESWNTGLVIEIGPVAQNLYDPQIIQRFITLLNFINSLIEKLEKREINFPKEIVVHFHQKSIDYPRDNESNIKALIHPDRINKDWMKIQSGDPLFIDLCGQTIIYEGNQIVHPVFIGEAAYKEKNIAMSFTEKKILHCSESWINKFLNFHN